MPSPLVFGLCALCRKPSKVPLAKFPEGPITKGSSPGTYAVTWVPVCPDCVTEAAIVYKTKAIKDLLPSDNWKASELPSKESKE